MSDATAEIAALRLTIEKLRRELYGQRSERKEPGYLTRRFCAGGFAIGGGLIERFERPKAAVEFLGGIRSAGSRVRFRV